MILFGYQEHLQRINLLEWLITSKYQYCTYANLFTYRKFTLERFYSSVSESQNDNKYGNNVKWAEVVLSLLEFGQGRKMAKIDLLLVKAGCLVSEKGASPCYSSHRAATLASGSPSTRSWYKVSVDKICVQFKIYTTAMTSIKCCRPGSGRIRTILGWSDQVRKINPSPSSGTGSGLSGCKSTTCQPERVEEDDGHDHLAGHDREGIVEVVARHNLSKTAFQMNR